MPGAWCVLYMGLIDELSNKHLAVAEAPRVGLVPLEPLLRQDGARLHAALRAMVRHCDRAQKGGQTARQMALQYADRLAYDSRYVRLASDYNSRYGRM